MALNKKGVDWKAIGKDQKAIDKLPNHGRAYDHKKKELAEGKRVESPASKISKNPLKKFYRDFSHVPAVRDRKDEK